MAVLTSKPAPEEDWVVRDFGFDLNDPEQRVLSGGRLRAPEDRSAEYVRGSHGMFAKADDAEESGSIAVGHQIEPTASVAYQKALANPPDPNGDPRPYVDRTGAYRPSLSDFPPDMPPDKYRWDPVFSGEAVLKDIAHQQGFDGLPRLEPAADIDARVAAGEPEILRSVSNESFAEQFRTGDVYYTPGFFGSGLYGSGGGDRWSSSDLYANSRSGTSDSPGAIIRMTLDPSAKVISYEDAQAGRDRDLAVLDAKRDPGVERRDDPLTKVAAWDVGRWAALQGYDAIACTTSTIDGRPLEWVVLNRTAVHVQEDSVTRDQLDAGLAAEKRHEA